MYVCVCVCVWGGGGGRGVVDVGPVLEFPARHLLWEAVWLREYMICSKLNHLGMNICVELLP